MKENLLQYIWKEKYYQYTELVTESGEELVVLDTGHWNKHQGPDFLDARIRLNGTLWAGNIEIHIKSSQWYQHNHADDPHYRNVILHVVWEDDDSLLSSHMPTLVLQHRVSSIMLDKYNKLMQQPHSIPCQDLLHLVNTETWDEWKQVLLQERLRRKASLLLSSLHDTKNSWEEATWWWIARHFGGPVNAAFFEQVARSISTRILARHRNNLIQLEALLLGQANLLQESNVDPYVQLLQREYLFLRNKYQLKNVHGRAQLLRMRPAGFPAIRLAQLAMLVKQSGRLHFNILEATSLAELEKLLEITANDFWHYHYTLEEPTPFQPKHLGKDMQQHLIINAMAPLVFAFGTKQQHPHFKQRSVKCLENLDPEHNSILRSWKNAGVASLNAADSQSLTELRKCYCSAQRCLDCKIGQTIIKL